MKKMTKILLVGIMALCLLSGCYKQDTTIKIKPSGAASVDIAMIGNDAAISQVSGGMSSDQLMQDLMPQIEELKESDSMTAEEISEQVGEETYKGVRITAKYKDVSEMLKSMYFVAFNSSIASPVGSADAVDTRYGLQLDEITSSPFGNTYTVNGNISLTQGESLSDEEMKQLSASQINMTFKFPVLSWSNWKFIAPTYSFSVNADNPNQEVHFWVFVPNYVLLLALLIIIGLLIAVIVLASKLSKLNPKDDGPDFDSFTTDTVETLSEDDENFFEGFDEDEAAESVDETAENPEESEDNE